MFVQFSICFQCIHPALYQQSNQKVTVHINNENSKNCVSNRGMSVFAVEVPARTKMVRNVCICTDYEMHSHANNTNLCQRIKMSDLVCSGVSARHGCKQSTGVDVQLCWEHHTKSVMFIRTVKIYFACLWLCETNMFLLD